MTQEGSSIHSPNGTKPAGWGIAEVLYPFDVSEFLDASWGKSYRVIKGTSRKFEHLLNWSEVESLLECGFPLENLHVVKDGKDIPRDRYLYYPVTESRGVVNGQGLHSQLTGGATLVLDFVDRHLPRVRQLASDAGHALHANVRVNLYAGWRTRCGFSLHWDVQDALIMQIEGRKAWRVFAPTRPHPLEAELEKPEEPSGPPVWEGVLEAGDVLYMPRGWWHVATPMDERSLHLTLSIIPANGADLLRWLCKEMLEHPEIRANTPRLASVQEQQAYLARLRNLLAASITDNVLERFHQYWDSSAETCNPVRLPGPVISRPAPISESTRLRLAIARRFDVQPLQGSLECKVSAGGHSWRCAADFEPALRMLNDRIAISLDALCSALAKRSAGVGLSAFLTTLILSGVILVDDSHPVVA